MQEDSYAKSGKSIHFQTQTKIFFFLNQSERERGILIFNQTVLPNFQHLNFFMATILLIFSIRRVGEGHV